MNTEIITHKKEYYLVWLVLRKIDFEIGGIIYTSYLLILVAIGIDMNHKRPAQLLVEQAPCGYFDKELVTLC